MKDIIGAMRKEREYLSFRMKGEEPYHFVDAVKEYGFEGPAEYFYERNEYLISKMKFDIIEPTPDKAVETALSIISSKRNTVGFSNIDYTLVLTGNLGDANEEYCKVCNIPIYPYHSLGGSIVATAGDMIFCVCIEKINPSVTHHILKKTKEIFKKYTSKTIEIKGNDLMVDGTKVLGSTEYDSKEMVWLVACLSFSSKNDLIENICLKHSTKQPGYIDFMTREDFRREVAEWLRVS
jgi:hypothetical protein